MRWIKKFLENPISQLFAYILGIAGFVVGYEAIERPKLCWFDGARQSIVSVRDEGSHLEVHYNGKQVSNDITALQLEVWNEGNKSIKGGDAIKGAGDVLSPLEFTFASTNKILEARQIKVSRPLVNSIVVPDKFSSGVAGVKWDILEPGDGFVVQLVVLGTNTQINAAGAIEHQKVPKRKEVQAKPTLESNAGFFGMLLVFAMVGVINVIQTRSFNLKTPEIFVPVMLVLITIGIILWKMDVFSFRPGPPFVL